KASLASIEFYESSGCFRSFCFWRKRLRDGRSTVRRFIQHFTCFFGENSPHRCNAAQILRRGTARQVAATMICVFPQGSPASSSMRIDRVLGWAFAMLDIPTLFVISTCVTSVLGLFLLFAWVQDRSIRALAWWGAAYLLGGLAAALWSVHDALQRALTVDVVYALLFAACGIIWNGARMFHSRPTLPGSMFAGAILWLIACQIPVVHESDAFRIMLGSFVIANYTLFTAYELWRERGEGLFSRWPAIVVLAAQGTVFSLPIPLVLLLPADSGSSSRAAGPPSWCWRRCCSPSGLRSSSW